MNNLSCCQLTKKFLDQTITYIERKDGENYQMEFSTFKEKDFSKIKENYVILVMGLSLLEKQSKNCAFCCEIKEGWKEMISKIK